MARLITVKIALALVAVLIGCSKEKAPGQPEKPQVGSAETAGSAAPAPGVTGSGDSAAAGSATAAIAPPPGDDKLTPAPKDVVSRLALVEVAHGLRRPVLLVGAPNDARRRLFIVEQRGTIRFLESGKLAGKTFFELKDLAGGNEQGLLGLAFHPQFATNRKLYVNYTTRDKDTHIDEYQVSATDPDAVDMSTKRELAVIDQPYSNHNGGHVEFGPDGKLYTGLGDGGAANDPERAGQDPKTLLAKILRFDVDAAKPTPEIVHMGLRNPWRFTFDKKTGDLLIGDVGQNLWEYVHGVRGGDTRKHNFGWNVIEGSHCFDADSGGGKKKCDKTGFTLPLVEYSHDEGCSITGGVVYRGKALPELDGRYFYADYCTGLLRSFVWNSGFVRDHWDWKPVLDREGVLTQISSFGTDHDGELYIVELTGSIYKLARK